MSLYLKCTTCFREQQIDVIVLYAHGLTFFNDCPQCKRCDSVLWEVPNNTFSRKFINKFQKIITTDPQYSSACFIYSNTRPDYNVDIHDYWRGLNLIGTFYEDEDMTLDEILSRCSEIQSQPFKH